MTALARFSTALGLARSVIVYYGQPWRRRALKRFYRGLVAPGDMAFDIGAHVGSRSRLLLALGVDVVAVEPQPAFADFIERYFAHRLKGLERVAVGASLGEITLCISSRHPTVTTASRRFINEVKGSRSFRAVVWDREIRVPVTTLDALIEHYGKPAFCKIDVEGAEAEILKGLSQPLALVAFEYIPAMPSVAVEAIQLLMRLGTYQFNRVVGEHHEFTDLRWKKSDAMLAELAKLGPDAPSGDVYARLAS